jgi:tetratricopeptide (TPR) repeat protein
MTDPAAESRIHDLKKRLAIEPSSTAFVALAEEFRRAGKLPEALAVLQKGLARRPGYVTAQVALGRVQLETGQIDEAIAMFARALASDPGNLISARSLAEIYLSRGEKLEAVKKYKLYRGLSGDRRVDEVIGRLEKDLASATPEPVGGRTLADLYLAQGHYAEALGVYEGLAAAAPGDPELARLRSRAQDLAATGKLAETSKEATIAVLKYWLSVIQTH